jgi:hypothetical protein
LEGTAVGTVLDGAEKKVKELEVFKKIGSGSGEPPSTSPETEQRQQLLDGVGEQLGGLFPSLTLREPPVCPENAGFLTPQNVAFSRFPVKLSTRTALTQAANYCGFVLLCIGVFLVHGLHSQSDA